MKSDKTPRQTLLKISSFVWSHSRLRLKDKHADFFFHSKSLVSPDSFIFLSIQCSAYFTFFARVSLSVRLIAWAILLRTISFMSELRKENTVEWNNMLRLQRDPSNNRKNFTRFFRLYDCLSHNRSPSECRPKTVALLTSNALIICHGTFHIFMKGKMNELRHTRATLLTSFLSTVHSFFWWGTHKRCSREEPPNCSYTFLQLQDLLVFFTFFSTFNGYFYFELIFYLFHFYLSTVGTTVSSISLRTERQMNYFQSVNLFTLTFTLQTLKDLFSVRIVFFFGAKISIRSVPNSKT